MGTTTRRGERGRRPWKIGCLAVLIALLWSGVCAAQIPTEIQNPSFEETYEGVPYDLPSWWTLDGYSSFYSFSTDFWTDFWPTDGDLSVCVCSRGGIGILNGEYQGFYQIVDLTGVGGIIFDAMLLASDDGGWAPFEASFVVTSLEDGTSATVWSKSAEDKYLDQVADVSAFTGPCLLELRLMSTANAVEGYNAEYAVFWDNFAFFEAPVAISASVRLFPDTLTISCNDRWNRCQSRWVACFIELGEGYDATQINGSTVHLNDIPAYMGREWWARSQANWMNIADTDWDGILERVVMFERADIEAIVAAPETAVTVYGELLDGTMFQGTAVIKVIDRRPWKPQWQCRPWKPPVTWRFHPPCRPH
ncbi:MAG: hypothetical protein ABFE13_00615 [Phycisphaerales bacterium]